LRRKDEMTQIVSGVVKKDAIKDYNTALGEVIFPEYCKLLDEIAQDLDNFYKGHYDWYNEKEKHIMLYDSLDDALLSLKMDLWTRYNSLRPTITEDE